MSQHDSHTGCAPLEWLESTQDDLATLAELLETVLAAQGRSAEARKAWEIWKRYAWRRNKRNGHQVPIPTPPETDHVFQW